MLAIDISIGIGISIGTGIQYRYWYWQIISALYLVSKVLVNNGISTSSLINYLVQVLLGFCKTESISVCIIRVFCVHIVPL